jgi:hypothetical protein
MRLGFVKTEPFPATEVSGLENTQRVIEFLQQHNISVNKIIWICLYIFCLLYIFYEFLTCSISFGLWPHVLGLNE